MDIAVPVDIEGSETHILGADQGFRGLPVRFVMTEIHTVNGSYVGPTITTAWKPDAAELAALNAGAAIYIDLNTQIVSPMIVYVGEAPEAVDVTLLPEILR